MNILAISSRSFLIFEKGNIKKDAMKKFLIISLYIMCSSVFSANAYDEITFTVPNFHPYTYQDDGKIKGIGVDVVTELLDEMKVQNKIKFSPNYGRALDDLKKGKVDGFFLASQNAERDNVAVFSSRIALVTIGHGSFQQKVLSVLMVNMQKPT